MTKKFCISGKIFLTINFAACITRQRFPALNIKLANSAAVSRLTAIAGYPFKIFPVQHNPFLKYLTPELAYAFDGEDTHYVL